MRKTKWDKNFFIDTVIATGTKDDKSHVETASQRTELEELRVILSVKTHFMELFRKRMATQQALFPLMKRNQKQSS